MQKQTGAESKTCVEKNWAAFVGRSSCLDMLVCEYTHAKMAPEEFQRSLQVEILPGVPGQAFKHLKSIVPLAHSTQPPARIIPGHRGGFGGQCGVGRAQLRLTGWHGSVWDARSSSLIFSSAWSAVDLALRWRREF